MSVPAVEVEHLSKIYRVYASPWDRLREALTRRPRHREFRALDDVSFALPRGEGLALIGENGAGKSTLLKILAGITAPTGGAARVEGKIASILELGSAFHPEFTGRQNIVLNAAMLGLTEREVREKTPGIVAFSELGDFIDQPVKTYSTGMAMRLGFAIATQVEPDVLIIDEALSVGDGYFQKKCMDRLSAFVDGGGTLLFCSHAMYYVSAFCQRALWLRQGQTAALGPTGDVVREYETFLLAKAAAGEGNTAAGEGNIAAGEGNTMAGAAAAPTVAEAPGPAPLGPARLTGVRLVGTPPRPAPAASAPPGPPLYGTADPLEIEIEWETDDPRRCFHVGVGVNRIDGVEVCSFATHLDDLPPLSGERVYSARLRVPSLPLVKGEFMLYVFLLDEQGLHIYDQKVVRRAFAVESPRYAFGLVRVEHRWDLNAARPAHVEQFGHAKAR